MDFSATGLTKMSFSDADVLFYPDGRVQCTCRAARNGGLTFICSHMEQALKKRNDMVQEAKQSRLREPRTFTLDGQTIVSHWDGTITCDCQYGEIFGDGECIHIQAVKMVLAEEAVNGTPGGRLYAGLVEEVQTKANLEQAIQGAGLRLKAGEVEEILGPSSPMKPTVVPAAFGHRKIRKD